MRYLTQRGRLSEIDLDRFDRLVELVRNFYVGHKRDSFLTFTDSASGDVYQSHAATSFPVQFFLPGSGPFFHSPPPSGRVIELLYIQKAADRPTDKLFGISRRDRP